MYLARTTVLLPNSFVPFLAKVEGEGSALSAQRILLDGVRSLAA
jgi:hypothetical protein